MNSDKQSPHSLRQSAAAPWAEANDFSGQVDSRHRFVTLVSRAAVTYAVLCFSVALFMSLLGIDPLVKRGLMPKALLLFVGLATLIAAANIITDYTLEHGLNWRNIALNALHSIIRTKENSPK